MSYKLLDHKESWGREWTGLMKVNAWHHRADAMSSVVALIGIGLVPYILMALEYGLMQKSHIEKKPFICYIFFQPSYVQQLSIYVWSYSCDAETFHLLIVFQSSCVII